MCVCVSVCVSVCVQVLLIDDQLAKVFGSSPRAQQLCPDLPAGVAAAVSLGRFTQEPLAEFCSLWSCADSTETFGYEACFLDLHPLKVGESVGLWVVCAVTMLSDPDLT